MPGLRFPLPFFSHEALQLRVPNKFRCLPCCLHRSPRAIAVLYRQNIARSNSDSLTVVPRSVRCFVSTSTPSAAQCEHLSPLPSLAPTILQHQAPHHSFINSASSLHRRTAHPSSLRTKTSLAVFSSA
ncbi:hypothetical protein TRVL_08611 [Trypanosoma vivax]|nr:hypothetical protein TRVL_08611 [Trypanosoma vivax]